MINPYATLGIEKTATQEEIKKAFRKLAKKHHPDINPNNKKSEEKFKEITHAYDLIGTKEERLKFDNNELDQQQNETRQKQWQKNARSNTKRSRENRSYHSFADQFGSDSFFEDLFKKHEINPQPRKKSKKNSEYKLGIDFKESVLGVEKIITLERDKKIQITIPAGITTGTKLRFKNQGNGNNDQDLVGDAIIEINVEPLSGWTRVNLDLETEIPISFIEAILGAEISVNTMYGPVMLKIPNGSNTGNKLRIKGKGIRKGIEIGNHIVKLKIMLPAIESPELKSAIMRWNGVFDYNPREYSKQKSQENRPDI